MRSPLINAAVQRSCMLICSLAPRAERSREPFLLRRECRRRFAPHRLNPLKHLSMRPSQPLNERLAIITNSRLAIITNERLAIISNERLAIPFREGILLQRHVAGLFRFALAIHALVTYALAICALPCCLAARRTALLTEHSLEPRNLGL